MKNILSFSKILRITALMVMPITLAAQSSAIEPKIDSAFSQVRSTYSQETAFNTVAFVEQFWRLAGNSGFDTSIYFVEDLLKSVGFEQGGNSRLQYRIEKRDMDGLTWEPLNASLTIVGETEPLLKFQSNRNMIAVNSWPTTEEGVEAEVIHLPSGTSIDQLAETDVSGKIVFTDQSIYRTRDLVFEKGAIGLMVYNNPTYTQPEKNINSIQFKSIKRDTISKKWAIILSYAAQQRLKQSLSEGQTKVKVRIDTKLYQSEELTLVADIIGSEIPQERIVYSAHVQEPGANDNASGVGAQAEMVVTAAKLLKAGKFNPKRTMTFLFGDEIVSTRRYIEEDEERAKGIKWGISLDMVGQDTKKTGGTFLIEKMPDPGAIWTRGIEKHSEWGGSQLNKSQLVPNYLNDFVIDIFNKQGQYADWIVKFNPYEGGSDHVPFLRADIPGLLLWHFTDQFYHTDGDRIDKVSAVTLKNVGTGALVTGMILVNSDAELVNYMINLLKTNAKDRISTEYRLSRTIVSGGGDKDNETDVVTTWSEYYISSLKTIRNLVDNDVWTSKHDSDLKLAIKEITQTKDKLVSQLAKLD